jgi:hypothetical protein
MRKVLLSQGDLLTAMQASIALPVWFDPVRFDGMVLLDGGISNLAPLEPFMELADAHIVSTAFYYRELKSLDPLTVLNLGLNIGKSRTAVEDIKEFEPFLIRNDVEEYTYMGWNQLEAIIQDGYEGCDERIDELEDLLRNLEAGGPGGAVAAEAVAAEAVAAQRDEYRRLYEERWQVIQRKLAAGRVLPLPRGFSALKVRPILLKRYRGQNGLEQNNYLETGWSYEAGTSALEVGALTDFTGTWGALLSLGTAFGGSLFLGLDNYVFVDFEGTSYQDARLYHHLRSSLPVPIGKRVIVAPFVSAELLADLPEWTLELLLEAGLDVRLSSLSGPDFLGARANWFFQLPNVHGLENELTLRKRLVGPLNVFGRGLLRASWPPAGQPGITLTYNDFFRGLPRRSTVGSFAVFNNELLIAPEALTVSLWETLVLKGFGLAGFCDLYWPEAIALSAPVEPSTGASLTAEAALMGLISLTAVLSGGYDFGARGGFVTFNLGAVY